jgi:hypothetical protein
MEKKSPPEEDPRAGRNYKASALPIFRDGSQPPEREATLLALYTEICGSWRSLHEVRFKLLGLVPTVSVVAWIAILARDDVNKGLSGPERVGIMLFGFLITLALFIYDRRNSQLYDDLISRARRIEDELGIDTGQFRGRKKSSHPLIQHDVATNLIYLTSLGGWLLALLAVSLGWV